MTLCKDHLISKISSSNDLPKRNAHRLLESLLELIKSTLESGESIMISGFGKFEIRDKKNRRGRNPQSGDVLILDARRVVTYRCSGALKKRLNHKGAKAKNSDGKL